jgi:hypothetical protein
MDSPEMVYLKALWITRSNIASARAGSGNNSCQEDGGVWPQMSVGTVVAPLEKLKQFPRFFKREGPKQNREQAPKNRATVTGGGGGENGGENENSTNQYAGSVAQGDIVSGKDITGKQITGKVYAKGRDGITVLDEKGIQYHISWAGIQEVDRIVNDQDAIRLLYNNESVVGGWRNGDDGYQPDSCDNVDGLLKAAAAAREDFNAISGEYAKRFNKLDPILIRRPVLKGIDRIKEKLRDDYDNGDKNAYDPGPPETYHTKTIRDTDGHTFTLKSVSDVARMLETFDKDRRVIRIKNNFAKPSDLGYSDINMNIRLPNGTIAEIQLNTTANLVAKERYGHSLYEVWRTVKGSQEHKELKILMEDAQKALYSLSNRDSKSGAYEISENVREAILNGDMGAIFREEHKEYAEAIKPFVEKALPLLKKAIDDGLFPTDNEGGENKVIGHFKDLLGRLKNI